MAVGSVLGSPVGGSIDLGKSVAQQPFGIEVLILHYSVALIEAAAACM